MSVSKTLMRKGFMIGARYSGLTALMAPFSRSTGAILMLHRVGAQKNASGINDFLSVEPRFLYAVLDQLKQSRYRFVSMDEAADRIKSGHRDERFLAVTLDDGYRDNLINAVPVFSAHDVPYTVYVCPGLIDGEAFLWWEVVAKIIEANEHISFSTADGPATLDCSTNSRKQKAYDELTAYLCTDVSEDAQRQFVRDLAKTYRVDVKRHCRAEIMSWSDIRQMASNPLCSIGAHTLNHFHLKRLDHERAVFEVEQSARVIALETGETPRHFAYPYGGRISVGPRETAIARDAGFATAVTTRHGLVLPGHKDNMHALPRISVNGKYQQVHYLETMLSGITVPMANRGQVFVTV